MNSRYIYLATPYSHSSIEVRNARYAIALHYAAIIASAGVPVYAPIVAWHPASQIHKLPGDAAFWQRQNDSFMVFCAEGWFLESDGSSTSEGMAYEDTKLSMLKIPIRRFTDHDDLKQLITAFKR